MFNNVLTPVLHEIMKHSFNLTTEQNFETYYPN